MPWASDWSTQDRDPVTQYNQRPEKRVCQQLAPDLPSGGDRITGGASSPLGAVYIHNKRVECTKTGYLT